MTEDGREQAPRETAAGLMRDGKPPKASRDPRSGSNPASQPELTDRPANGKHVTADKWNGRDRQAHQ